MDSLLTRIANLARHKSVSRVYIGQEDFLDLRISGEVHLLWSVLENRNIYYTQGLRIYVVDEKHHLHVC